MTTPRNDSAEDSDDVLVFWDGPWDMTEGPRPANVPWPRWYPTPTTQELPHGTEPSPNAPNGPPPSGPMQNEK